MGNEKIAQTVTFDGLYQSGTKSFYLKNKQNYLATDINYQLIDMILIYKIQK